MFEAALDRDRVVALAYRIEPSDRGDTELARYFLFEHGRRHEQPGAGLAEFLQQNLPQFEPAVADEIRKLASEVNDEPV